MASQEEIRRRLRSVLEIGDVVGADAEMVFEPTIQSYFTLPSIDRVHAS